MVGVELQGTVEPIEGACRKSVAGAPRLRFRPVRQEGGLVAEKRVGALEADKRVIEAFERHLRAGQKQPAAGVVGVAGELRGKGGDHRFHRRGRIGAGRRVAGRGGLRVESVR